ncbi:hypothetical protein HYC85_019311 [Camellia sinensis]|uniref:Uncharacterized protein n=1 Tax=Camellia sinensis TaxID=4442 RepID=A0A7J7GLH1_CAMSI|nr:hypothetical protein HYC85_019311 [Camellia sinensis]
MEYKKKMKMWGWQQWRIRLMFETLNCFNMGCNDQWPATLPIERMFNFKRV